MQQKSFKSFFLFLMIFTSISFAQVKYPYEDTIRAIKNIDELNILYQKMDNAYDRRYLLQVIPFFFDSCKCEVPEWLKTSLTQILDSNDDQLVSQAVFCIGKLKLVDLLAPVTKVYQNSYKKFGGGASTVMVAVLQCLNNFDDQTITRILPYLVHTQQKYLLSEEQKQLIQLIADKGDSECLRDLQEMQDRLNSYLSNNYNKLRPEETERLQTMIRSIESTQTIVINRKIRGGK